MRVFLKKGLMSGPVEVDMTGVPFLVIEVDGRRYTLGESSLYDIDGGLAVWSDYSISIHPTARNRVALLADTPEGLT